MISNDEILAAFNKRISNFFAVTNRQQQEIYRSYEYRDCHQWNGDKIKDSEKLGSGDRTKNLAVINMLSPIIRAASGVECMQDNKLDYIAMDDQFDVDADIIQDGSDFIYYAANHDAEKSLAKEDAMTCGIGTYYNYLDFSRKDFIAGYPSADRIFPGFTFFDPSVRAGKLNTRSSYCGFAEPIDNEELDDYIASKLGEEAKIGGESAYKANLLSYSHAENIKDIDFLYHYFWWEWEDIYDVANPFAEGGRMVDLVANDPAVANIVGDVTKDIALDWRQQYWSLDPEAFKAVKDMMESIEFLTGEEAPKLSFSKRRGKTYYKAEFARGAVIESGRCFTQGQFPMVFYTGYYDEVLRIYYGMARPLSFVQDALNMTWSEFLDYVETANYGGSAYISGAGEAIERVKKEKAYKDVLTPIPPNTVITPKQSMTAPEVMISGIQMLMEIMPRTIGLSQEFLGVITTGDMTDSLYGRVMRQSYAVLAHFANASIEADKCQGMINVDMVKLMAAANDNQILPILSPGHGDGDYFRLSSQNLARSYAIRVAERPMSADEKQDTFNKWMALMPNLPPELQQGLLPLIAKYSNFDYEDRKAFEQLATPSQPAPNPMQDALLESQVRLTQATASEKEAAAAEKAAKASKTTDQMESDIEKNLAQAAKYEMDARYG